MLRVEDLTVCYEGNEAVRDVTFTVDAGEFVGVVGESGAGKSTLALALLGLAGDADGSVWFRGVDLVDAPPNTVRRVRGSGIALAFQDASESLHPAYAVGAQIAESIDGRLRRWRARHEGRVETLLDDVGLESHHGDRYPHELSGGQQRRALIALSLAGEPAVLVADEPTRGLDTVTQTRVLEMLADVAADRSLSVLCITHDLGVVADTCDRTLVMHEGELVDQGPTADLIDEPGHEYTRTLLRARAPRVHVGDGGERPTKQAEVVAELDGVTKHYCEGSTLDRLLGTGRTTEALEGLSLTIRTGESVALVGCSGAGKTTAARLVAGLESPTEGQVRVLGEPVGAVGDRPRHCREAIGYVFQAPRASLDARRRVAASVGEPLQGAGLSRSERHDRIAALLADVGLEGYGERYPQELSGGEAQRVAVARALANDPELLVLDEATSALDAVTKRELCDLLTRLGDKHGISLLVVTHDLTVVRWLAGRTMILEDGRVTEAGRTSRLLADPAADATRALVAAEPTLSP